MRGLLLALCVLAAACDFEAPQVQRFTPADNTELRGVGFVDVVVEFSDSSETTVTLLADGRDVDTLDVSCDDDGHCTADGEWDNTSLPAGTHELAVRLEDSHGNVSRAVHAMTLEDVLEVTSLRVTNIVDDYGGLEIEVYAFAEAGADLLGCAGSRQKLDIVDIADYTYETNAILIDPSSRLLGLSDMGARAFRIEVWEDDDAPVCPVVPNPNLNDLVGRSPARTPEEWATLGKTSFDSVDELTVAWARPLRTNEPAGTDTPTSDFDGWDGNGGCSTTGDSGGLAIVLIAVCLCTGRSRRFDRSPSRAGSRRR
jgi:hypothetical protein